MNRFNPFTILSMAFLEKVYEYEDLKYKENLN